MAQVSRRHVLLVLTVVVALIATPVAPAHSGHRRNADVMTYNLYLGGDLTPILTAQTFPEAVAAATGLYLQVVSTDFHARAASIAHEIEETSPALIGLQEVSLWQTDTPADGPATPATEVAFDFLKILLQALDDRGLDYAPVSVVENFDGEAPTALGFDVRLTDRDVILARTDLKTSQLKLSNSHAQNFETNLILPSPVLGPIEVLRGWNSIDVKVRGKDFRLVNTHLEAFSPAAQVAQAQELLAGPAGTSLPVVMAGDFNSAADGSTTPTYGILLDAGFTDAWSESQPGDPGFTCCQAANLDNATPQLDERIDLLLFRGGGFSAQEAEVVGEEQADRTPSGLWPSDHAGVFAELGFGPGPAGH
ncbi:MAG: endonuclease/exonuclease/phosphatase family protein [Actinomycetota bacterium]